MLSQTHFQLGGLYHLTIDDLYEEDCLKDIKDQLEAIHGVRLQRAATEYELVFVCKNGLISQHTSNFGESNPPTNSICNCGYHVRFSIQFRMRRDLYKLQSFHLRHLPGCRDSQEAAFLRNKRMLANQSDAIMKIVAFRRARGQQCSNPKSIFNILCEEVGLPENFLYAGIEEEGYKRKLKKRLDNLIAEARRVEINPRLYLSPTQYKQLYSLIIPSSITAQIIAQSESKQPKNKKKGYLTRNKTSIKQQEKPTIQKNAGKGKQKPPASLRNKANKQLEPERSQISSITSLLTINSEVEASRINPQLLAFPQEHAYTARRVKSEPNEENDKQTPEKKETSPQIKPKTKSTADKQEKCQDPLDSDEERKRKKTSRKLFDF